MSNRYELFIPAVFVASARAASPSKNSCTLSAIRPLLGLVETPNLPGSIRRRMDLDLTQEQELVRDTVREFARERIAPVAEELDRESRFPYELVAELGELGLMGLPIPRSTAARAATRSPTRSRSRS